MNRDLRRKLEWIQTERVVMIHMPGNANHGKPGIAVEKTADSRWWVLPLIETEFGAGFAVAGVLYGTSDLRRIKTATERHRLRLIAHHQFSKNDVRRLSPSETSEAGSGRYA